MTGADLNQDKFLMTRARTRNSRARCQERVAKPTNHWERRAHAQGFQYIAGVDEVGRGCLFGPVVAAAVILNEEQPLPGLNDSKRLHVDTREKLSCQIREQALAIAIAAVDSAHIDYMNIYQATRKAMRDAVLALPISADYLLVDAMKIDVAVSQQMLIGGDRRSCSIAAASIVAKVERDRWMRAWNAVYPEYELTANKGYATPAHLRALRRLGPTPLHRNSFRPVSNCSLFPPELNKRSKNKLSVFRELVPTAH